jgi:uncharacterized protein (DUF362 family)
MSSYKNTRLDPGIRFWPVLFFIILLIGCPKNTASSDVNDDDNITAPQSTTTKIALQVTGDRSEGIRKVMELLEIPSMEGKHVVVKPNFNTSHPTPGSTHNETLRQIMVEIQNRGASDITLAERSYQRFQDVITEKGIDLMANDLGFNIVHLDTNAYSIFSNNRTLHWPEGFRLPNTIRDAEYIVSTCCLKTHHTGVITMSLKNSVGIIPTVHMQQLHNSPRINSMIAEINLAYKPDLIILDGIVAFIDGGPSTGTRVNGNVIIAGTDRIAVDVVGAAVLEDLGSYRVGRGRLFELEQISRAVEINLGIRYPHQIEFITGDSASAAYAEQLMEIILEG